MALKSIGQKYPTKLMEFFSAICFLISDFTKITEILFLHRKCYFLFAYVVKL